MLAHDSQSPKNIQIRVKQRTHAVDMHENDFTMTCNTEIYYVVNTLKKINISITIFNEFTSTYYDDNNDGFTFLFKYHTYNYLKKHIPPSLN